MMKKKTEERCKRCGLSKEEVLRPENFRLYNGLCDMCVLETLDPDFLDPRPVSEEFEYLKFLRERPR